MVVPCLPLSEVCCGAGWNQMPAANIGLWIGRTSSMSHTPPPHPADTISRSDLLRRDNFAGHLLALVPNLRAFATSLAANQDRADDLATETILKASAHQDSFKPGTNLRAWLFTIMRNTFFSELRLQRRHVNDSNGLKVEEWGAQPPEQDGHIDLQDLRRALIEVPAEQREA